MSTVKHIRFRKASQNDSEFAYKVKKVAFEEYVEKIWGWDEDIQRQLHEELFKTQEFRIIELSGVDVGIMAVEIKSDHVKVNQLFLLPCYQGKGIGTQCMDQIMKQAAQMNLPIRLRVLKINPRALVFYERIQFTRIGETNTHILLERSS